MGSRKRGARNASADRSMWERGTKSQASAKERGRAAKNESHLVGGKLSAWKKDIVDFDKKEYMGPRRPDE